jgi:hypothetical protein
MFSEHAGRSQTVPQSSPHLPQLSFFGSSGRFSRKLKNQAAAVALNYFSYNIIKIHRTLRMTPAMAAGVTDHLWSFSDLIALWESYERTAERAV